MKQVLVFVAMLIMSLQVRAWGFYAHRLINQHAVFLLPPAMLVMFKPAISYLSEHAVDPDKRRYAVKEEAPRHYIDLDAYGPYPFELLPRKWDEAVLRYGEDSLRSHGILPWWIEVMRYRLTEAFRKKDHSLILRLAAESGHYIGDAHVPLHTCSNYNGQKSGQQGIHGLWETRIPELFAESQWDLLQEKAEYLRRPSDWIWSRILESARSSDSVLTLEKRLSGDWKKGSRYAYEERNGHPERQFSAAYATRYDLSMKGMVERRFRESVRSVASFWYTAWVDAGQPDLSDMQRKPDNDPREDQIPAAVADSTLKNRICD